MMVHSPQLQIIAWLAGIVGAVAGGCYAYAHGVYAGVVLSAVAVLLMGWRILYAYRSGIRMLVRLLDDVKYHDNTLHFLTENKFGLEKRLAERMNGILSEIKKGSMIRAEQSNYYETLLNIIDSCLIVLDEKEQVYWMNQEAELQLCGHAVHHIEELAQVHADLPKLIRRLVPGKMEALRIYRNDMAIDMAVTVTEYQRRGRLFRLVHLRNIRSLLEDNEMEAWQKLVRVLTHEIMNSIAPIISLSDTLSEYTENEEWTVENRPMLRQGLLTILRRSKGLLEFVENYRKLTRISSPVMAPVRVGDLLSDLRKLCAGMPVSFSVENEDLTIMMDRSQMEQVVLNLIKNANEACAGMEHPAIKVTSSAAQHGTLWVLSVADNGCGILPEVVDKIFVPFFTTKPAGSGIGLSLCKQVVSLHGGRLSVKSEVDRGSVFTVKLLA